MSVVILTNVSFQIMYHSMYAPFMTSLNQQLYICIHEWNSHCHRRAVGQNKGRVLAELLDDTEDVVPSATVQTSTMITELIYDLQNVSEWS